MLNVHFPCFSCQVLWFVRCMQRNKFGNNLTNNVNIIRLLIIDLENIHIWQKPKELSKNNYGEKPSVLTNNTDSCIHSSCKICYDYTVII